MADLSGRKLGDYTLREKIGDGGYGDVYRAEHRVLRRVAVVKVLNEERQCADHGASRFLREAQLASQLRHTNAAHIYDFGVDDEDELMWIAMEYVDGITLADWLQAHGPMSLGELVPLVEQLAEVVEAAHQCGIVHRDLKPSNVMVIEGKGPASQGKLVPKLLDFGIAKGRVASIAEDEPAEVTPGDKVETALIRATPSPRRRPSTKTNPSRPELVPEHGQRITRTGAGFGSRPYMSPEQWGNASCVGPAADIYSLGVIVYEALTGRVPFTANNTDDYCREHCFAAVPPLGDGFSSDLDRVLCRALAKRPNNRHASVLELASELRKLLQADPHEQIRSLTRRWHERGQSPDLLARGQTLAELRRSVERSRVAASLSDLESSFITMSVRRARRARWGIGALVVLAAMSALVVRAEMRTRVAEMRNRMAEQNITEAEIEQGRQALIHGESHEAVRHLEQAYQRGDHSPGTEFMLARALQPRMSELARFASSSGRMWSAMFAPDGKRVLTTDDKAARMWDAGSGQLLFMMNHGDTVYGAVFSPDGSRVITAGGDGTVRIWSAATGAPIRELSYQGSGAKKWRYYAVAMSSHFVAAIDVTGKAVHVWDAETGTQIAELDNDGAEMQLLAFSADGHWLATSGRDEVRVFDTSRWRRGATITGPRVRSLSFDPSRPRLAVGTADGVASIWEIPSGELVRCLRGAGASVDAVAFSRDGALVATASRDGMEQVWDAASGALRTQLNSHHDMIYAVEFSANGGLLLSAGADGAMVISSIATGMPARLEGPKGRILAAHFDRESRRVVGASWDGTARVWDAVSPYRRWESSQIGADCDTMDSLVPDQRFIALSCRNHGTHVWDTARGELLAELPSVSTVDGDYFSALPALTSNGDRAAIARGNTVEVYALPSGQLLRTITHPAAVNAAAFAPAGHDLVSGAVDGSLLLTHDEGEPVALPTSSAGIDAAAILADGRVVAADASDRLRVIGPGSNALLMDLAAPSRMRLLRPSPDGTRLVTISTRSEQAPLLYDLDQRRLVSRLDGHVGRVFTARFVAEGGREILTAASDGTVRLWDAATGSPRQIFPGDSHSLADAALAPDGSVIVAGGSDGFLRFWDTSNGHLLWTLQAHSSFVIGVHWEGGELVTRSRAGDVARWALPSPDKVIEACHARTCASPAMEEKIAL
jgi:WD40 repeat protein/serine/threonine protein kinase